MTLHKPSYFVERLQIISQNNVVYDEKFHKGLNILWGANSSGKTTVLHFLYYAMGGNTPNWKPKANSCEKVFAQVSVNEESITTMREFREGQNAPLSIYYGNLENSQKAPITEWSKFPYARGRSGKDSYSQVLFDALEMPYVPVGDVNVTMYQLLRLAYQNQMTSPQKMFRADEYDPNLVKETVGDYVCGIFNPNLYQNQLKVRKLSKQIQNLNGEQSGLHRALGIVGEDFDISGILSEQKNTLSELSEVQSRLEKLSNLDDDNPKKSLAQKKKLRQLKKSLDNDAIEISSIELEISSIEFQTLENSKFVESLEHNLIALNDSDATRQFLGNVKFEYCPECLAPINHTDPDTCRLCKTYLSEGLQQGHRLRLKRELEMQIEESRRISVNLFEETEDLKQKYSLMSRRNEKEKSEYISEKAVPLSEAQQKIQELSVRVGYLNRQLEILEDRLRIGQRIDAILRKLVSLKAEKSLLDEKIKIGISAQTEAKIRSKNLISEKLIELLNRDLPREDSFNNIRSVSFEFGTEDISVNGETRFAASSSVYLKNCFGLALLLASLQDAEFRFPRILILDALEDKGLEEARIHNFQNLLLEYSENSLVDHQIILTSQTLSESLQRDDLVINRRYLDGDHTLEFPDSVIA